MKEYLKILSVIYVPLIIVIILCIVKRNDNNKIIIPKKVENYSVRVLY